MFYIICYFMYSIKSLSRCFISQENTRFLHEENARCFVLRNFWMFCTERLPDISYRKITCFVWKK